METVSLVIRGTWRTFGTSSSQVRTNFAVTSSPTIPATVGPVALVTVGGVHAVKSDGVTLQVSLFKVIRKD